MLASGEPVILDEVGGDPRFSREAADSTGSLPKTLMAVPLIGFDGDALGVLQVLDRRDRSRTALEELELLGRFADQAALALELLVGARPRGVARSEDDVLLAEIASLLERLEGERLEAARRLLGAMRDLATSSGHV